MLFSAWLGMLARELAALSALPPCTGGAGKSVGEAGRVGTSEEEGKGWVQRQWRLPNTDSLGSTSSSRSPPCTMEADIRGDLNCNQPQNAAGAISAPLH